MIEFIFFKIVVPVAAAVICGLLVWLSLIHISEPTRRS